MPDLPELASGQEAIEEALFDRRFRVVLFEIDGDVEPLRRRALDNGLGALERDLERKRRDLASRRQRVGEAEQELAGVRPPRMRHVVDDDVAALGHERKRAERRHGRHAASEIGELAAGPAERHALADQILYEL